MKFWALLAFVFLSSTSFAKQLCEEELLLAYGTEYSAALVGGPTTIRTLRPEEGSIAFELPEILARIANMAHLLEGEELQFGDYTFVWTELQDLALDQRDARLGSLVASVAARLEKIEDPDVVAREPGLYYLERNTRIAAAQQDLRRLADHMWEFAVATMVAGEHIYLGKQISYVHQEVGQRNPEIDVIAVDKFGHERWIEVKNAKVDWWRQNNYMKAIARQARLTGRARASLSDHKIDRELVFVEPFPYREYQRVLWETGYDRMNSLFLDREEAE